MKIVLKKVRKKTPFTWLDPIKVEPLELAYLKAVLDDLELDSVIIDPLYHPERVEGDIVILNGYNTARDQLMLEAKQLKTRSPETIVIGSGVDVQVNWECYMQSECDYLVVSNRLGDFKNLIEHIVFKKQIVFRGVLPLKDVALCMACDAITTFENIEPSRTYFDAIKHQTRYLLYENVALVKRSHGCPYGCAFCFCKQLNQGHYVSRSYDALRDEMANIRADYFWVVDDVFMRHAEDAKAFISSFKEAPFKLIVYLRADFIVKHAALMSALKESGIIEVIIGFESIKASALESFHKGYTPDINTEAIAVLREAGLSFTALFMVDITDDHYDFKALKQYIRKQALVNYTFSIFTPLKGTDLYSAYETAITDFKCDHYDFLHLVLRPLKMHPVAFKIAFVRLFVFQFFHSKGARQLIAKVLRDGLKNKIPHRLMRRNKRG